MRATLLASLVFVGACFSPDLSDTPFACGSSAPECPDGYDCVNGTCTKSGGGGGGGGGCPDQDIEPNDTLAQATQTAGGQRPTLTLEPLAICPDASDIDVFAFTTPGTQASITASITYGASGPPLTMQLQNSSGQSVVTPTTTGNEVSAFVNSPGTNTTYYVVVSGGGENTYSLTITTSP